MRRRRVDLYGPIETFEEQQMTYELEDLRMHLDHYSVKYPDEATMSNAIEQLRTYVPRKKQLLHSMLSQSVEAMVRLVPIYRFTGIGLFLLGSLLLPNKIY